eukprot:g2504.t1
MNDSRKEYVIQCVISVLNIPRSEFRSNSASNAALETFLDDGNHRVLQALEIRGKDKRTVALSLGFNAQFFSADPGSNSQQNEMHFIKTSTAEITPENIHEVLLTSSLRNGLLRSLSGLLKEVYVPILNDPKTQELAGCSLDGKLGDHLIELDAGLKTQLRRGLGKKTDFDAANFARDVSGILTPIDEVRYWQDLGTSAANIAGMDEKKRRLANRFAEILTPLAGDFEEVGKKTFAQLLDMQDSVMSVADELWREGDDKESVFPQKRMVHFLQTVGGALGKAVQSKLQALNVWQSTQQFNLISKYIREGHKVCEKWNENLYDWTGTDWKSGQRVHLWDGEPMRDEFMHALAGRVHQVAEIRTQHDQILKLCPPDSSTVVDTSNVFESFAKVSTFTVNDYTLPLWNAAVEDYEKRMQPLETTVADRLRKELFASSALAGGGGAGDGGAGPMDVEGGGRAGSANPAQSVRVFQRYSSILERANVRTALTNEREKLLAEIADFLERVRNEFEMEDIQELPMGRGFSEAARKVLWLEQLRTKTETMLRPMLSGFLKDLPTTGRVANSCKKLRQELRDAKQRCFKEWEEDMTDKLGAGSSFGLELQGKVMEFDTRKEGALRITYPEGLVHLIKEVRMFEQMQFVIPKGIKKQVELGLKFYRFAVQLKQICNFHNHLGAEILPCQKLLVLNAAVRFEKLFADGNRAGGAAGGGIRQMQWDSVDRLEDFTLRVKDGAQKLRSLNRKLRIAHAQIGELVLSLSGVSLLRQREVWKQKLQEISKVVTATTTLCDISDANELELATKPWRVFWDHQLFKIMECQYKLGMESLNESLPEMKADLIFVNKQCKLKPPVEELRTNYYKEIKSFIQLPLAFKGLEGAPHIYKAMPDRNPDSLQGVFAKAEELFEKVVSKTNGTDAGGVATSSSSGGAPSLADFLVLGQNWELVNDLVDKFEDTKEWDVNFKFVKQKKKEVEKLPDVMKIDCVTLSTVLLKSTIEDQLDRFSDLMIIRLKKIVTQQCREKIEFFEQSLEKLNVRPDSVSELGQAQAEAAKLIEKQPVLQKEISDLDMARPDAAHLPSGPFILEDKSRLLKSVYSFASLTVNEEMVQLHEKYDEFELRLQTFETLAAELREELLSKMGDRVGNMNIEIEKFASKWQALKPKANKNSCTLAEARSNAGEMVTWQEEWEGLKESIEQLLSDCRDFGLPEPGLVSYEPVENDLQRQQASWALFQQFIEEVDEMSKQLWIEFRPRLFKFPDLCIAWEQKLREAISEGGIQVPVNIKDAKAMKSSPAAGVADKGTKKEKDKDEKVEQGQTKRVEIDQAVIAILAEQIGKLRQAHPILKSMTGEAFEKEHWKTLFSLLSLDSTISVNNVTVTHFVSRLELMLKNEIAIKELAARALGEVTIREALMEITSWFELTQFEFTFHTLNDGSNAQVPLVKEWKDLLSAVSDKQALCNSLKDSRYFAGFKDQTQSYSEKLGTLDTVLLIMNKVQRKWVYLEPIFARGALPKERERFERVNRDFRAMMRNFHQAKKVHYVCTVRGIIEQFSSLQDQLDRCQKALNTYLEEKRSSFPRLYFIGDEDLLEILGQSSNPAVIQTHLKKLFAGIHSVEFEAKTHRILCMKSSLGEMVELATPVRVMDEMNNEPQPVEQWLSELARNMVKTLSISLDRCLASGQDNLDLGKYPSQVLNLSNEIRFTQMCESAIVSRQVPELKQKLVMDLNALTELKASKFADVLQQAKLKALILDVIHQRTVVDEVGGCHQLTDWAWYRQLRYYSSGQSSTSGGGSSSSSSKTEARMLEARQNYTFEYQGNAPKLVHTPLTDKCYLTMMHGMHLGYGGNPYGPAGTGKTESVKALGAQLGRQVLVFNCDEGIDYQAMARIFIGLVRCGAWGCFDEFNRLLEEQMSAISQSIQVIQHGIKHREREIKLVGRDVEVNHNAGIFITLNPAVKGYGGRQKLPDNLKQLFRPVAMSAPDNEIIAEVLLFSEGYRSAHNLAKKIVSLFLLSRQLLSPQQHYDWGLRALKTVLTLAGRSLFETKEQSGADQQHDEAFEALVLLKSTRMNTLSKLTYADARRFEDLCQDVFPGISVKDIEYAQLEKDIRQSLTELKMNVIESQITKMLQFHEACQQRMGVGIVGPSGCGKSTIWQVLAHAYKKGNIANMKKISVHVMNPKSMPRKQLLGHMNLDTREWFDGVLTVSARNVVKDEVSHSWIICDGDIDPEWVESLNSVLDDNRLLTLPSGERIQFGANVNFIFETHSLLYASPATVTRMGMIFLSEEDVDVKRLVKSWILSKPEKMQGKLDQWFEKIFFRALDFVYGGSSSGGQTGGPGGAGPAASAGAKKLEIETTMFGLVRNVLGNLPCKADSISGEYPDITEGQFVLAVCNGFGCNLTAADRTDLIKNVFDWMGLRLPDPSDPLNIGLDPYDKAKISTVSLASGAAAGEEDTISSLSFEAVQSQTALVPTTTVARDMSLFYTWLEDEQPIILQGPEGCGKNMLLRAAVSKVASVKQQVINIAVVHCNGQTSSVHVLQKLRQFCAIVTGAQGKIYRPRSGRRLILYLKDINLPKPDKYDTSQIIAFLQQVAMHNGFYDEDLEFVTLESIQIVCSMAPCSTLGRHHVSTRFTANVRIASIFYPTRDELRDICTTMLFLVFQHVVPPFLAQSNGSEVDEMATKSLASSLAGAMVDLYSSLRDKFTTDNHEHYVFSPRDLTLWVNQLTRYMHEGDPVTEKKQLLEAFANEARHIFRDRLVREDQLAFDDMLTSVAYQAFSVDVTNQGQYFRYTSLLTRVGGSNFAVPSSELTRIAKKEDYRALIAEGLKTYEREVRSLGIELFDEVLENLAKMDRVLASKQMNDMCLIGKAGVGRRSLLHLMSHLQAMQLFSPSLSTRYGRKEWSRDLKAVMQMTGIEKQDTVFFVEDHHLVDDFMVETLNSLLSAGEVPGLYTAEELEPVLNPLKQEFAEKQDQSANTPRTLFEYFVSEVRAHLRVVLSMDPTHPHFRACCASNPALFKDCAVIWLDEWTEESKDFVCNARMQEFLSDITMSGKKAKNKEGTTPGLDLTKMKPGSPTSSKDPKEQSIVPALAQFVRKVHNAQISFGATPRHLVTLLQCCQAIYGSKIESSSGKKDHLEKGLRKLQEVYQTVETLQNDAVAKQMTLQEKQLQAQQALEKIRRAMARAAERKQEVEQLEKLTQADEHVNKEEKMLIEEEMSQIKPILDAAKKAVGSIKQDHLAEIRSLKMPPEPIHDVLQGVLRIMGNYDASWGSMKKFLTGAGMIQKILNFNVRSITPEIRRDVEKLVNEKANSYDPQVIYRVSVAAAPLAKWVVASVKYSSVLERISPMENKLAKATENLAGVQGRLQECREQLAAIDQEVADLQTEFEQRTQEATVLQMDLDNAEKTLSKAKSLISKLSGEKDRWSTQVGEIKKNARQLPVHSVLAAAACTYLGHYSEDVREQCQRTWLSDSSQEFSFLRFMATESELLTWKHEGLPGDQLSQENGVLIKHSVQVPFIVDPNSQAILWLENQLAQSEVALQQDPKVLTKLELAVRFGKTLILKEAEGIPAVLFPVLRQEFTKQGPRLVVQVGERACDYNESFKLYLCTRNSNALDMLPPNASCLVARVNFSVTRAGLEGQLLGVTLAHEKPELESRKSELLQKEEGLKVQLSELETQLLEQLADSSGNLLENEGLIRSLEETKKSANTISDALNESTLLQKDLDEQREAYRPLATLGSRLFILLREFHCIDHMYRFSLEFFTQIFNQVLATDVRAHSVETKIKELERALQVEVLYRCSRSVFKADRLTFGVHLVNGIAQLVQGTATALFQENEWEFFLGSFIPPPKNLPPCNWCPAERVEALNKLRAAFSRIDDAWGLSGGQWGQWAAADKAEDSFPPDSFPRMTAFQRILLLQAVRPDRLETGLQRFACDILGVTSLSPPPLSLPRLLEDELTTPERPALFMTTPGADPSVEIEDFASGYLERVNAQRNENFMFRQMAMGGGQNDEALELLNNATQHGDWLLLKNLHLVISWLPALEKALKNVTECHPNFRCWLTTEPHAKFPPILLESSLKITYEAPPGLKKNLQRTFESWTPEWFGASASPETAVLRSQILFLCAHFHAIMQERRTYIPQGWTKFYEFASNDLASACETVSLLLKKRSDIDWQTLHGVLDKAVYGSRVDNDFDSRLVRDYLSVVFRNDALSGVAGGGGGSSASLEIPPFPIPRSTNLVDFKLSIERMPDIDNPASFGMPANVDRSLQRLNSAQVITNLRQLKTSAMHSALDGGGGAGGAGGSSSSSGAGGAFITNLKLWEEHIGPLWKFWETTRLAGTTMRIRPSSRQDTPVTSFLLLDATEAQRLVGVVSADLAVMRKVVSGTGMSTPDIQAVATRLIRGELPDSWAWPSAPEDPVVFLQQLSKRSLALKNEWMSRLTSGVDYLREKPVRLADFLRPDVFLNALRQQTARKLQLPMDSLTLVSSFQGAGGLSLPGPELFPVSLEGLLLEGAAFDRAAGLLLEVARQSNLISALPELTVSWASQERVRQTAEGGFSMRQVAEVEVPIYTSLNREKFLCSIRVPTDNSRQRVFNSTAMFLTDV